MGLVQSTDLNLYRFIREKAEKSSVESKLCIWKKKRNVRFLTNRGIETGIGYVGKRQKNHWVETNCVFGRRRKLIGFGQTVDLKI